MRRSLAFRIYRQTDTLAIRLSGVLPKLSTVYCLLFADMPELPDIVIYLEALDSRILGQTLEQVTLGSPFLLRTVDPPISSLSGKTVVELGDWANAFVSDSKKTCGSCST